MVNALHFGADDRTTSGGYLSAVLNNVVDGIIAIDPSGEVRAFNAAAEKIFGYQSWEIIGKNVTALMPEPYRSAHAGYLHSFLSTGEAKIIGLGGRELLAQRADGSVFPMELGVSEVKLDDVHFFVGIIRDISERKRAERDLRDNAARLNAVMNTAVDGLITIDEAGCISSFNPAAEKIFGYTAEEAIGKNVKFLMPEPYHSAHDGYLAHYHETGEKKIIGIGREVTAKRKDGTIFPIDLGVSEMMLDGMRAYVGIVRDITARKQVEGERMKLIENLQRSNQELDDFAYIASHDLKEPLRGLYNNATFLSEDSAAALDETGLRRLERICYLSQRMDRLIDELLYFSRLGRQDLALGRVNLNTIVRDVWDQVAAPTSPNSAHLEIPGELPSIVCDGLRIGEVFRNLFSNALKYNKSEEKRVEVAAVDERDGRWRLSVRDNGIGIAPEYHQDVFTLFKRLNPESDQTRGSGVGLTFAKKIVERHDGRIWVESEPDAGTTFHFTLKEMATNG